MERKEIICSAYRMTGGNNFMSPSTPPTASAVSALSTAVYAPALMIVPYRSNRTCRTRPDRRSRTRRCPCTRNHADHALRVRADRTAQLAVAARHQRALRLHRLRIPEHRMMQVRLGAFGLLQRDRPLDAQLRVREVHERVRLLLFQTPVRAHQIRVHGPVLQGLEAVAHAARHVDCLGRSRRVVNT